MNGEVTSFKKTFFVEKRPFAQGSSNGLYFDFLSIRLARDYAYNFVIAASDCRAVRKYPSSFHKSFSKKATLDDMHQSILPPII